MSSKGKRGEGILAEALGARARRAQGYREQALKIHPWICASCAREFTGKNLHQLTVHHKDHDHTNNPADGSNWELLCVYCHDDEHSRGDVARAYGKAGPGRRPAASTFKPFAGLDELLKDKK